MTHPTRIAAGTAASLAVGALALFNSAAAVAAPATITWDNQASHYTRTVSNATPAIGDTITVSTKFERTDTTDEKFFWLKDFHPACLSYVSGTAKVTDGSGNHAVEPYLDVHPTYIAGDFTATGYQVIAKNHPGAVDSPTFTAQYTVGADCALDTDLASGVEYLSSLGHLDFQAKGPAIRVAKPITTTLALAPVSGATAGKASTLTATVAPATAGGTVTFKDGDTAIGSAPVGSDGTAAVQWTPAAAGAHTITAQYTGAGSATQTLSVTVAADGGTGGTGGTGSASGLGSLGSLGSLLGGFGSSK
ncbi:Ig-like domain-containing protein [Nocardia tengchongensis]|uniref:Ig-like domain-containing protein n=1 Tax=Nocardia tengchongensis TaxID=2055889 RepID=UPI00360CA959